MGNVERLVESPFPARWSDNWVIDMRRWQDHLTFGRPISSGDQSSDGSDEIILSGMVISGDDLLVHPGYVCLKGGRIKEVGQERTRMEEHIIAPALVNSHTHLADGLSKDPPYAPLSQLVGPGGLKHRLLESASCEELRSSMRSAALEMLGGGTCAFADFREGGPSGVSLLLDALHGLPLISRIFGRPDPGGTDIHPDCFGLGLSSTRDHPWEWVKRAAVAARSRGMHLAVHAGESGRDDIESALSLQPDLLIHLTSATPADLEKVAGTGASVAVCPRSNLATGCGLPDISAMVGLGINVCVGSDNLMLNSTNLFREMELISKALLHDDRQVFKMCTLNGAKALGLEQEIGSIEVGKAARIMVVSASSRNMKGSRDPLASLVRRAEPSDILAVF
ncbi:MAG: chlorohydrolase [Methanosaeta sp. PtaU1.Bin028]|nr:MAG: chlorohydrolase [Methanosaeta sp. PtaU1.Bin028]